MPKVSVIIPCYNQGQYIEECVNSVLDQTFQDFEIVIVNDGSTDAQTNTNLKNFNKPKTKIIHTENKGVSAARNTAIHNSSGEYILPLDADDKIEKAYLEKAVPVLDANENIGIVYCDIQLFGNTENILNMPAFEIRKFLIKNSIHVSGMFRKSDYDKTKGYDEQMKSGLEDWEFWISLIKSGVNVHKIKEPLLLYRRYETSRQALLGKDNYKNTELRNYIAHKHLNYYAEILGTPMQLHEEINRKEAKIERLLNSKPYKLGSFLLKPFKTLLRK